MRSMRRTPRKVVFWSMTQANGTKYDDDDDVDVDETSIYLQPKTFC